MGEEGRRRLADLVAEALEHAAADRDAFIDRACAGDDAMASEARSLIAAASQAGGFLEQPTKAEFRRGESTAAIGEGPGAVIGNYKLLQQIGEGGFGVVFLAEQREPVRRQVALKIIKLGMDTRAVVARFEAERQALAMMDHPNIARVLDAGATESGRPYFVMDLVQGDPIVQHCDRHGLDTRERLELFCQVCRAVQHAHTKGVIHRDIKPGNVLVATVDGRAVPKVIDFGIAKATEGRLTEKTFFTEFRQMIGTPAYMSPEQAGGSGDIDTRTDVYSLGVLLYELLTGVTPFDPQELRSAAWGEMQRIIREEDPPKPSTRLSTMRDGLPSVAAQRHTEPSQLTAMVRGDLDWIVMRCLEKDRGRRYQSAGSLVDEINRHLTGEAVEAAPPDVWYRGRKFVRRHRVWLSAIGCIAAALLAGLVATGYGMYRAVKAERLAIERFEQAEHARADAENARAEAVAAKDKAERFNRIANAVTEFFTQDLLNLAPRPAGAPEVTVRELLDAVPQKIDKYFKSEPAVEGIIRERVGQLYRRLGELKRSTDYLVEAIPLLETGLGAENKATLSAVQRLGELRMDEAKYEEAAALFDKAYQGRLHAYGTDYSMTLNSLVRRGAARASAGRIEEGLADIRSALDVTEKKEGRDGRNFVVSTIDLMALLNQAGRWDESLKLGNELLDTIHRTQGPIAPLEWPVRQSMSTSLCLLGRGAEALAQADDVMRIVNSIYPPNHPVLVDARISRGQALAAVGQLDEAATELEASFEMANTIYGPGNADSRRAAESRAEVADKQGDADAAALWRSRQK
jgi:serine/threonine protein kinase/tetratricopeptide (TPR) repeat protein